MVRLVVDADVSAAARVMALDQMQRTFVIEFVQDLTPALSMGMQWTGSFQCQSHLLLTTILYPHRARLTA